MEAKAVMRTRYVERCEEAKCAVDPSVLTSLETDWSYVKASNEFSLLPLLLLLRDGESRDGKYLTDELRTLRIKRAAGPSHLADANARVLAALIRQCRNLTTLDLRCVGLTHFGALEIAAALPESATLRELDLSYNPGIGLALAGDAFESALRRNASLVKIDLTSNQLGFFAVKRLHAAMKERRSGGDDGKDEAIVYEILDEGNNVFEEILNAVTHGVGSLFSIVGTVVLMHHASAPGQSRRTFYSCLAYCMCLVLLFFSSTALHAAFLNQTASTVLGLLDHAAIYFLIAGTHLPFCVISLEEHPLGDTLAILQWVLALLGIIFCIVDERIAIPYKMPIELTLYLGMGWMMAFVWDDAVKHISEDAINLLALGGFAYSFGVIFFIMEKTHHPIGHAIWHVFVLVGAMCHYFAVLFFVVGLEEESADHVCLAHHLAAEAAKSGQA